LPDKERNLLMDKIVCVGKNYADHVKEMAAMLGDASSEKPVLFLKPPSVLREAKAVGEVLPLRLPPDGGLVHHECEIVLRLSRGGFHMSLEEARDAIQAVTLGLDMTRRDLQAAAKQKGQPWTTGKVFLDAAAVGPWVLVEEFPNYLETPFRFFLGGKLRQEGRGAEMLTSPSECVAYASSFFPLCAGDLIFTGTPSGVGPVVGGDTAQLEWGPMHFSTRWVNGTEAT